MTKEVIFNNLYDIIAKGWQDGVVSLARGSMDDDNDHDDRI